MTEELWAARRRVLNEIWIDSVARASLSDQLNWGDLLATLKRRGLPASLIEHIEAYAYKGVR